MSSSVRQKVKVAVASDAVSPSCDIGGPVWLSHEPVHETGKGRTGSVTLAIGPMPSTQDGCSPNSPNSSGSSTRFSSDDLSLEMEGANYCMRLNFGSEMKYGGACSRLKPSISTIEPAKVNSSQEQRGYKDIWSTVKLVAEAGSGSTAASHRSSATSGNKVKPSLPSEGSVGHASGQCKPCAFFHIKGCENGALCKFCHLCDPGEKKRRAKDKIANKRKPKQEASKQQCQDMPR